MQILNIMKILLFEPNNTLISLFHFPLSFIGTFIIMLVATSLFNVSSTTKQKFLFILLASSLNTFSHFVIPTPFDAIFLSIVILLLVKYIFKVKTLKSFVCLLIPYILIFIFESIISLICFYGFGIVISDFSNIPIYAIGLPLFIYLLIYLLYLLCKKSNIKFTILDNFNLTYKTELIICSFLGIIALYLNFHVIFFYIYSLPTRIIVISILVSVIYFTVTIYSLIRSNKFEIAKQNIETLQLYNKTLTTMHDNIRAFKHDFNNILQAIGGYIELGDIESLKKYYNDLIKDSYTIATLETLNPESISNPSIYSILVSKYYKADSKNINFNFEICIDLNSLNISTYELTRMLGIFLDNSIEAAEECDEKIINIRFYDQINRNRQLVIIENTYANKDINTIKIFEKSYTTKENNTGLGVWEVNKILNKHDNLSLFTTKNDNFFIQQLEIYKK